ncbi:MAG TPA: tetratricopeptide repeat protein [Candidatus Atribacteria bacterium]|nr:tetratricopeptide repeat protein [Candidatus Atribacteria bacterium]
MTKYYLLEQLSMKQEELTLAKYNQSTYLKAIETSIIALVVLVPLVFYPRCITLFVPPKEAMMQILLLLALMFWGLEMINKEKFKFTSTPLNFPIVSFMAICVLSLIWSNNFFISLKELPLFLAGPLLYFIVVNNLNREEQVNRILAITLIIGGLFGIYGLLQYRGIDFSFWIRNIGRQQVFGLFGNVNFFAEYLIVPLPIAVSLFFACRNKFKKTLLFLAILVMGTTLVVTFTRSAYLGCGISLVFMIILFITLQGKSFIAENKKLFIIILVAIIIITLLFVIPTPLNKSGTIISTIKSRISLSQMSESFSISSRISNWKFTALMIKDHPLIGSGIGTYKYNSLRYQARFLEQGQNRSIYPYVFADKTHNEYLQLWAEVGIVGLGIFIWLIISYFNYGLRFIKRVKNRYKQGMIIGLMGAVTAVLIDSIFGFPLHLSATIILFWLAIALTIVMVKSETDREEIPTSKKDLNQISRFQPLLFIIIIFLTTFLCLTVSRPFIARTYWYYGNKEMEENKDLNQAIKMYNQALKWDPYLGEIHYQMGKILQSKGINTLALEYFEKAERYVDHPDLPKDLASLYLKQELLDKAAIKYKQAISYQKNEKSMLPLYSQLGSIYFHQKKYQQAEAVFRNALEIDNNFVNFHYGLASVYLQQNSLEEALRELQKVIELAPDSQMAKNAQEMIQKIAQEKLKAPATETVSPPSN